MDARLLLLVCGMVKLGMCAYDYSPPKVPAALYETPAENELVVPPQGLYEEPSIDLLVAPQNLVLDIVSPPPETPLPGMAYNFEWDVQDSDTENSYSHVVNSDGQTTQGEYRVLLPDGRTQVVTFYDKGEGFNAEITYEE